MNDFVMNNIGSIVVVAVFIIALLILYVTGQKKHVKSIVLSVVVWAEKEYGSKTGDIKYAAVVEKLYSILPKIIIIIISKKQLGELIEDAVKIMKKILAPDPETKATVNLLGFDQEFALNEK